PAPDAGAAGGTVLYPEGRRHSPITQGIVDRLQAIAATPHAPRVFAKLGDSITASRDFLACFDGGAVELGSHGGLATTISYFLAGDAAGTSPFDRTSVAAVGGTTTRDVLTGTPPPLDRELTAVDPRLAVIMFGTNDVRYGRSVDDFGADLWTIVDRTIARGVVPILSTIPPIDGDPGSDARIPTFNRVARAIAQGRGIPLVDYHRDLLALPARGLAADGLHPSTAPGGACQLTTAGLQYGYNVRNLISVEALARTHEALAGSVLDASAPLRTGTGLAADPVIATLPMSDLADTRDGEPLHTVYSGCGATAGGKAIVYKLDLAAATTLDVTIVDRDATNVDVLVLTGSLDATACVAAGDQAVTATVGPGIVYVIADGATATSDGELVLVISAR
ncbi:MAG: SGNH/GDSL hydrolase family protein, partial [Myxococcota bacterium]|nr:SGNH/GDSL hydrolase family protein [Myxococcota bacterium]